jgi:hypothetical protein
VLCHVPNDIEKLLPVTGDFNPILPPTPGFLNLDSSPLVDYLYRRIYLPRVPTVRGYHDWLAEGYADPIIWRHQSQNFLQMIEYCRKRGVVFRVALLPFLRTQGKKFDQAKIHEKLRLYFEANQVPTFDLESVLQQSDVGALVVSLVDPHPNALAHRFFADHLWAFWPSGNP